MKMRYNLSMLFVTFAMHVYVLVLRDFTFPRQMRKKSSAGHLMQITMKIKLIDKGYAPFFRDFHSKES